MAAQLPGQARTENGAPAITAEGVMARMQANAQRGGALVVIEGYSVGPRWRGMMRKDGTRGAASDTRE